ncbi:MAG TPA: hypothetical protein VLB82_13905 [Thermodesulfobacteriota bacterium]|nr:hypothetical protein [Thermodesulfobacteriota bacterium]
MFDYINRHDQLFFEFEKIMTKYKWLNDGYRNIEKQLAECMEENRQLKIKLGERI